MSLGVDSQAFFGGSMGGILFLHTEEVWPTL